MNIVKPQIILLRSSDYSAMLSNIERIGRVCYKSEDKIKPGSAETFISGIISRGHESVIEHESITLKVICDRGVSHEIVRHRIASYSQESTRYCNYTNEKFGSEISCIDISSGFRYDLNNEQDRTKYEIWYRAMCSAEQYYFDMINAGARPEEARSVLPNSLKTELVITMNLREWRHFIKLRAGSRAHPQIKEIADMVLELFADRFPAFFRDLLVETPAGKECHD
jgi:thymidylate synthase, flavin-dependent